MYAAPLQDPYSEAFLTQAKSKRTVFKAGETENRHELGGASIRSEGSLIQNVGPTTEKEHLGIVAERADETNKSPCMDMRTAVYGGLHKEERGRQSLRIMEGAQSDKHRHTKGR